MFAISGLKCEWQNFITFVDTYKSTLEKAVESKGWERRLTGVGLVQIEKDSVKKFNPILNVCMSFGFDICRLMTSETTGAVAVFKKGPNTLNVAHETTI